MDEAREQPGALDTVCDVEQLQDGQQLTEAHHEAHGVEGVGQGICRKKKQNKKQDASA